MRGCAKRYDQFWDIGDKPTVALIKMLGFQLGYGYIAQYIAEYFINLMQQKKCLSIFAGEIEKNHNFFKSVCRQKHRIRRLFGYVWLYS